MSKKIDSDSLKELQDQEQKKSAILHDLGLLDTQRHSLLHIYGEIVVKQEGAKKELEEKYGKINIDLKDGSYKPIEEPKENDTKK
tara:strand:- start:481 stop:735 length:255 start_codon:yes stop_codon:yes gene_type:complete